MKKVQHIILTGVLVALVAILAIGVFEPPKEALSQTRSFTNLFTTGTLNVTGKTTFGSSGFNLSLHTISAGDSVFGHVILNASDTTLKAWNGSAWISIKDLAP